MSSVEQTIADFGRDPVRLAGEIQSLQARLQDLADRCSHNEARVLELQEELSCKEQQLTEAEAIIADLKRRLYGPTSETLSEEDQEELDRLTGQGEEEDSQEPSSTDEALEEEKTERSREKSSSEGKRRKKRGNRANSVRLQIERIILEPEHTDCDCCQKAGKRMGQEVTIEYDYRPAELIRREIVRHKYAPGCNCHEGTDDHGIVIAELPPRLVPQSNLGLGLAVYILLSRFDDHLSYYALERIFWERYGVLIPRQQIVQWVEKIAFWLLSLYELLWQEIKSGDYMQIDESPLKVLDPEIKGKAGQGFMWFYSVPGGDTFVVFDNSRSHKVPLQRLEGFEGTIQVDGYNAYKTLDRKLPRLRRIGCLSHARRKFFVALKESVADAVWFMAQIRELYRIERQAEDWSPQARLELRRSQAAPIWKAMKAQTDKLLSSGKHLPQSSMGKALSYFRSEYTAMVGYLRRGEFEIDNNLVENEVRPTAVGRKRWLFIGHPNAGWRSAVIYTFILSCRRRGINPQEYFTDVLGRLPTMKNTELAQLLPGNWKPQPQPPPATP